MTFDITAIKEKVKQRLVEVTGLALEDVEKCLETTRNQEKSDFTLQLGKIARDKPEQVKNINIEPDCIFEKVDKLPACFHLKIHKSLFSDQIVKSILDSDIYDYENNTSKSNYYGMTNIGNNQNVCIEHSSPNIAKKFHAGHLRTSIIGNSLVHLYKFMNWNVIRINHLGDWGKQFGLVGIGYNKYGNEEELQKDPIKHLLDVYVRINQDLKDEVADLTQKLENKAKTEDKTEQQNDSSDLSDSEIPANLQYQRLDKLCPIDKEAKVYFGNLEKGQKKEVEQWSKFRQLSLDAYNKLYKVLNIEFDDELGESYYALQGLDDCIHDAKQDEKGDFIYELGKLGNFVVKKSNGSTLYSSRDIAAVEYREKHYKPKKSIYVVAAQQELHFKRLFAIANGEFGIQRRISDNCELIHVDFGMINGLSTRKGNLVFLEDIINLAKDAMHTTMKQNVEKYNKIKNPEQTATTLAISALIIQDLSAKRIKNYNFDIKRCTSYEGHTGPYLQYTHCRLVSIKNKNENLKPVFDQEGLSDDAHTLIFSLSKFKSVLLDYYESYEPCKLVTFLMSISKQINSLFQSLKVFGEEKEIAQSRLAVFESARIILCNGIKLLGMEPLERM